MMMYGNETIQADACLRPTLLFAEDGARTNHEESVTISVHPPRPYRTESLKKSSEAKVLVCAPLMLR